VFQSALIRCAQEIETETPNFPCFSIITMEEIMTQVILAGAIERLDQVFNKLGQTPSGTDCPAIDGLIKEADATAGEIEDNSVLDTAIVANAQAVAHYEIARYGTLIASAEQLGHDDIVRSPQI
jgi:uncharacterized protein DUF892